MISADLTCDTYKLDAEFKAGGLTEGLVGTLQHKSVKVWSKRLQIQSFSKVLLRHTSNSISAESSVALCESKVGKPTQTLISTSVTQLLTAMSFFVQQMQQFQLDLVGSQSSPFKLFEKVKCRHWLTYKFEHHCLVGLRLDDEED